MQSELTVLNNSALKHIFIFLTLFILLTLSPAYALSSGSSYIPCNHTGKCECFIQEGDEGNFVKVIINQLIKKKYLPKKFSPKTIFTADVTDAVKSFQSNNNLEPTGTMDDDTLTLLIWDLLPEELDQIMPIIPGKPGTYPDLVYVPTDGGKKRHANEFCCNMEDPRRVSIRNAEKVGFDACKIKDCERDAELLLH